MPTEDVSVTNFFLFYLKTFLFSPSDSPEILIKSISPVVEGSHLSLACHVTGNPSPEVLWIRGSDNSVITRNNTIILPNITRAMLASSSVMRGMGLGKMHHQMLLLMYCVSIGTVREVNRAKSWFGLLHVGV